MSGGRDDESATQVSADGFRGQMLLASAMTLGALCFAVLYELHSTPYTMTGFLMGSPMLFLGAVVVFLRAWNRQNRLHRASLIPQQFQAGETIFRQGDPAEKIYIIAKGEVEVAYEDPRHGRIVLGRMGPQEYFGEGAVFNHGRRQATTVALTPVEMLVVDRADFHALYSHLPELRQHLQSNLEQRQSILEAARRSGEPSPVKPL